MPPASSIARNRYVDPDARCAAGRAGWNGFCGRPLLVALDQHPLDELDQAVRCVRQRGASAGPDGSGADQDLDALAPMNGGARSGLVRDDAEP